MEYFENLYSSKMENLYEMYNKFVDALKQPKLNGEDINQSNKSITLKQ
jgi:hypothetical protein